MVDKIEETIHNIKALGFNNPKTYVLTHSRFNIFMVFIFWWFKKKLKYMKRPRKVASHFEIEILMSYNYFNMFEPNERTQGYHTK